MTGLVVTRTQFAQTTAWVEQVIGRGAPSEHTPEVWARSLLAVLGLEVEVGVGDVVDGDRARALGEGAVVIGAPDPFETPDPVAAEPIALTRLRVGWTPRWPRAEGTYEVLRAPHRQEKETPT